MAKAPTKTLDINYLLLRCSTPANPINLGILGTIRVTPQVTFLFFVGNAPHNIKGLDDVEMKLVAAAPNAVREDLNQLTSQNVQPNELLDEVSRRYKGNIFASERMTKAIPASAITSARTPQQLLVQVANAIMSLAGAQKVHASEEPTAPKRRSTKPAARSKTVSTARRRFRFPQQFELTTFQI